MGSNYNTQHESYTSTFNGFGKIALVNETDDVSGHQFFITLGDFSHLNNKNIVIGEVVDGAETLYELAALGKSDGSLQSNVVISDCGVVREEYDA